MKGGGKVCVGGGRGRCKESACFSALHFVAPLMGKPPPHAADSLCHGTSANTKQHVYHAAICWCRLTGERRVEGEDDGLRGPVVVGGLESGECGV